MFDPAVLANPYPFYRRLRENDPVHWDPFLHTWIVTRYEDVVTVLHRFSANRAPTEEQLTARGCPALRPVAGLMRKQMLFLDPPDHTRLRSLAASVFTPRRVNVLREHIQDVATRLMDRIEKTGRMDVVADFAEPLPAMITAEMLGVPVEHHAQLRKWTADFAEMLGNFQHSQQRVQEVLRSVEEMTGYFTEAIRAQRSNPRDGLISALIEATPGGTPLTEEEIVATCIVTMTGGQETTTNLISGGLVTLLSNRSELQRLRDDLALIPAAVEELLRYESPSQYTVRMAPDDVVLGGKQIRKRQPVIAIMAAGNRDPEKFPDPDRLDLTRSPNRHLAFGWAAHFCFGAPLARIEGQIAFETLLRRLPHIELEPAPFEWRNNLGLRGIKSLPVGFCSAPPGYPGSVAYEPAPACAM
jgi:pimeloyl-[acyl-carrier protein] synthase